MEYLRANKGLLIVVVVSAIFIFAVVVAMLANQDMHGHGHGHGHGYEHEHEHEQEHPEVHSDLEKPWTDAYWWNKKTYHQFVQGIRTLPLEDIYYTVQFVCVGRGVQCFAAIHYVLGIIWDHVQIICLILFRMAKLSFVQLYILLKLWILTLVCIKAIQTHSQQNVVM